jgi:hypothetical protein
MAENKINNLLVKLSKKQLEKVLGDLPTAPFDMNEDMRTRRVPEPSSKTRIVIYIRYHWLDSEINGTLKSLKLPFLKEQTPIDDLTKNEIKRRWRILLEREIFRPRYDEIERESQAKEMHYSPREQFLCGAKQWQQHLERTNREEQKQREERRKFWNKKWVELGLIKG